MVCLNDVWSQHKKLSALLSLLSLSLVFIASLFIIVAPLALAQEYYADVVFDIGEDGRVDVSGSTNHPSIAPSENYDNFTSKLRKSWTFNISLDGDFSQYIAEVKLPAGASLNYLRTSNILSIDDDGGRIVVLITGAQEPMVFIVQYSFSESSDGLFSQVSIFSWIGSFSSSFFGITILIVFVAVLAVIAIIIFFSIKKNKIPRDSDKRLNSLTARQKMIYDSLLKNNGRMSQAALEKSLRIPKSSLSRNVDSMVIRGFISKESVGMSNILTIKKPSAKNDALNNDSGINGM